MPYTLRQLDPMARHSLRLTAFVLIAAATGGCRQAQAQDRLPSPPVVLPASGDRQVTLTIRPRPRVTVPAGRFTMGASRADVQQARTMCTEEVRDRGALRLELGSRCAGRFEAEAPQTPVFLPAFAIDRLEVSVADYAGCIRAGACRGTTEVTAMATSPLPIEGVIHDEAESFCRWRGGRLPTEAEWEKAARGPGPRIWPWGGHWIDGRANHGQAAPAGIGASARSAAGAGRGEIRVGDESPDEEDGFTARAPVGSYPAGRSPFGVEDMAGNVWEWTSTYFTRDPPQTAARFDPRGPAFASERTIRGGSYRTPPSDLRVTRRMGLHPEERMAGVGFRCAYPAP
jgi:formylglycine-generating enzyme